MYKKFSYFTKKGRFGRIIWTAAVLLIVSLFMGSGAMKSIYESGPKKLESTMSILKVIVGLHAIWFGYLGFYDFFNFYFSVKKKLSLYLTATTAAIMAFIVSPGINTKF